MLPPLVIVIEGNISSGKTTVLEHLASKGFQCYPENVAEWGEYLEEMYNGDVKTSDMLQMRVAVDQLKIRNEINSNERITNATLSNGRRVVFVERWIQSSEHIFIKNALNSEHMTITAKGIKLWRDFVEATGLKTFKVDAFIYIQSDPAVSYKRIMDRSKLRRSERNIPFEYIESLHKLYETFVAQHVSAPVLTIKNTDSMTKGAFAESACDDLLRYCAQLK